ncbi:MAG: 3-deoxy-7-phosphoheptulonate synthase [Planctomycetes bacterium]|nr:3-deoxy-7-phosphoheptulonate synthase [Planctomycetota bacterium]
MTIDSGGATSASAGERAATERLRIARAAQPGYERPFRTRTVDVGGVRFGGDEVVVVAGPCAVESRAQTLTIARACRSAGVRMLRGGAYKPRTSPYSFQGLGRAGLEILAEARAETGLPFVTEVLDPRLVELVASYADMLQIGSRNMQNFPLLAEVGRARKPVLLKRGFGTTVEEWLCSAEHILHAGNTEIVFCERGLRSFDGGPRPRTALDLAGLRRLRELAPFPVLVDPSHVAGSFERVPELAAAGLDAGAHGLLIEVIADGTDRDTVLCDGPHAIEIGVLRRIVERAAAPVREIRV